MPANSQQPWRVAIVGAGRMARHHVLALSRIQTPNKIVAVFDPDDVARERLLALCPGATGESTLGAGNLRSTVDVVHVCSPPDSHARLAREALEAGCHVYVEKPFASTRGEAEALLSLARERSLRVCAGHQLLFEPPTRRLRELRSALGRLSHIESFFAFHPSRGGLAADEQLKDVLPHPLYLLLHFLELAAPGNEPRVEAIRLARDGTVHALIEAGGVLGCLVVTLSGRPVESRLRLVGANGTARADYVRGIVLHSIGPGSSTIDKISQPFRTGRQLIFGTAGSLARRLVRRQRSYPGLAEILEAFYRAIDGRADAPLSDLHLLHSVSIAEEIAKRIDGDEHHASKLPHQSPAADPLRPDTRDSRSPRMGAVLVTGGTGFLGTAVVRELVARGWPVRVLARRIPAPWQRLEGVDYRRVDLAGGALSSSLDGCSTVLHCAAETSGGWEAHQRNSIDATGTLIRAAAAAGLSRFVHVSSVAVLARPGRRSAVREGIGLEQDDRKAGPYVWGKLNAEREAVKLAAELGMGLKVVRPGPIVDYDEFEPPGRLGRRIGNLFVAIGPRSGKLAVVDRTFAARSILWLIDNFEAAPDELNLLAPVPPDRQELVDRLKDRNPGLRVLWIPFALLRVLSPIAVFLQKVLRRDSRPIRLDRAFASEDYDTTLIRSLAPSIERPAPEGAAALAEGGNAEAQPANGGHIHPTELSHY